MIESLRERNVGLCAVDLPSVEGLPPVSDLVTSDVAYVCFHGRNSAAWWTGDAASRYGYRYDRDELTAWVPRLESLCSQSSKVRVYFNNHRWGNAAANARELTLLASAARLM